MRTAVKPVVFTRQQTLESGESSIFPKRRNSHKRTLQHVSTLIITEFGFLMCVFKPVNQMSLTCMALVIKHLKRQEFTGIGYFY